MKCIDCENCKIEIDEITNARARCNVKTPPKKGKIITWACTTYKSIEDIYVRKVSSYGEDKVKEELSKKKAPTWCPLLLNTKTVK